MRLISLAACAALLTSNLLRPNAIRADSPAVDRAALIEQLGHPLYAERRDARRRLQSLGLTAFDALRAACDDSDPEIAESSRQLLIELIPSWTWPGDPPSVRRLLASYERSDSEGRLERVVELAKLPFHRGVPALVRIARFDASDSVARSAAAALLDTREYRLASSRKRALAEAVEDLNQRYGAGERLAANWLDLAVGEADRTDAITAWRAQAERLDRMADQHQRGATLWIRQRVLWRGLRAALREDDPEAAGDAVAALLEIDPEGADRRLSRALMWVGDAGAAETAVRLQDAYAERLNDKRGLYRRAELALRFDDPGRAGELAAEALAAEAPLSGGQRATREAIYSPTVILARELRRRGRSDWALAEYQAATGVFAPGKPIDGVHALVAWRLADIHYDAGRYAEAAAALEPLVAASDASERYNDLPQVKHTDLPRRSQLKAHASLCRALAARDAGDDAAEQAELLEAIQHDSDNADIAIAMHRVRNPSPDFTRQTGQIIIEMRRVFEQRLWDWENAEEPDRDAILRASLYNQWAWLVSNTTGDYEKAVRYSRQSLQIMPEEAGYLDTLGRCYFSAGRLDEAIATQRRAVELQPWVEVMRRQLAEFESFSAKQASP